MRAFHWTPLLFCLLTACVGSEECDLIVHNAIIYTVDEGFTTQEAMAISDGKIVELGPEQQILNKYIAKESVDAKGRPVFPGFIDAHCHFMKYGLNLTKVNLVGTKSYEEVIERVKVWAEAHPEGWIMGRGWDQNDWVTREFPHCGPLDDLFPDRPVYLKRIDGHAAIINRKAMELSGITSGSTWQGGKFILTDGRGVKLLEDPEQFCGVLIDNAMNYIDNVLPDDSDQQKEEALMVAQQNCFEVGLTTVDDAGLDSIDVELIDRLQQEGKLKMRTYVMLSTDPTSDVASNMNLAATGIRKTDRLNVRSFKVYADGALGSRGAALKAPYSDDSTNTGLVFDVELIEHMAGMCKELGFQMNTHCIGDMGNLLTLTTYGEALGGTNDLRWRIEHAQVVAPEDQQLFKQYSVIPSIQPTHCTSDMYWAEERLGPERVKGAYAYADLLKQNGLAALGTDFPVEGINPMNTFYAAVARKDAKGWPEGGWQVENALTREEALRGMTIMAAISNFEENEKGSLEPGKFADFVILDTDIITCDIEKVLSAKVFGTYVNGERVFGK